MSGKVGRVVLWLVAVALLLIAWRAQFAFQFADQRTLWGWRTLGAVAAVGGMQWIINSDVSRESAGRLGWLMSWVTAALLLLAVTTLRERPDFQGRGGANPFHAFRDVWRNRHARLLLSVMGISARCPSRWLSTWRSVSTTKPRLHLSPTAPASAPSANEPAYHSGFR